MELITIGTSSAVPTKERGLPAYLIRMKNSNILMDCGEGAQTQLMEQKLGIMDIDHIFISHWHADHFSGLIGLVQTMELEGRQKPLDIYGPQGTLKFAESLLETGYFSRSYTVNLHEMKPGQKVEIEDTEIKAFSVDHTIPGFGYKIHETPKKKINKNKMNDLGISASPKLGDLKNGKKVEISGEKVRPSDLVESVKGRKIVYSGDTAKCQKVIEESEDADILLHEATVTDEKSSSKHGHTSAKEAGEIASRAGVEKLVLTHISRRYRNNPEVIQDEAKEEFSNTTVASDGDKFRLKPHRPEKTP